MSGEANAYRIDAEVRKSTILRIRISRPRAVDVARLAIGKAAGQVPDMLAQLLAVCSAAQHVASLGAIEAATAVTPDDPARRQRARAVLEERLHNALWRLAIDWPKALGHPERPQTLASARRLLAQNDPGLNDFVAGVVNAAPMEAMRAVAGENAMLQDRLSHALGEPAAALEALRELQHGALERLWFGDGGAVLTSRGLLRHRAAVADGVVTDYAIAAPTDLVMAPGGPVETALTGLSGPDLARRSEVIVALIDPCAPVELVFGMPAHA